MIIGVPKEVKDSETRVALTPDGVSNLIRSGHTVLVEKNAGILCGFSDRHYRDAGATILNQAAKIWKMANLIVKVKEPLPTEFKFFEPGKILFCYLHLAGVPQLARALCKKEMIALGYETVQTVNGQLPLLTPMSEVAGRIAVQIGAGLLHGGGKVGKGLLLGGVTGTRRGTVAVLGGGVVGINAAQVSIGLGAETVLMDINPERCRQLREQFMDKCLVIESTPDNVTAWVRKSDLVIGGVHATGDKTAKIVTKKMVQQMSPGSVIVDVSIDQGGCVETSRATTHRRPTYLKYNVLHYCVPNMPALTPQTSTEALTKATFPYVTRIAELGLEQAMKEEESLRRGLQCQGGKIVHPVVARLFKSLAAPGVLQFPAAA
ncbi:MAG: alanine dehydrogenase [Deltaproteobacteria bacterium]|nr:alanine dehydrogenase [Deltaproteobacteria bacterium]